MNLLQDILTEKNEFSVKALSRNFNKEIVIFGASGAGRKANSFFIKQGIKVIYFCDNDSAKWGKLVEGIEVISPEKLLEINNGKIEIVISSMWSKEITKQLLNMGISNINPIPYNYIDYYSPDETLENIKEFSALYELLADQDSRNILINLLRYRISYNFDYLSISQYKQYFHPVVSPMQGDTIIDGGAFTGDTVNEFMEYLNYKCLVYSFEPSPRIYQKLCSNLNKKEYNSQAFAINKGLAAQENRLSFFEDEKCPTGSCIAAEGNIFVNTVSIDQFFSEHHISANLIKLDIEGFEMEAIMGARNTILRDKPRMQICLYHKLEDLYAIPLYIHKNFPECQYSFYLGHHRNDGPYETVLYAISNKE